MARIAVTGLGLVTAAGIGVAKSWRGACAGQGTARRSPLLAGLPVEIACAVPDFDPSRHVGRRSKMMHDRFVQLAITAAREAVADAGLDPAAWNGTRVGVVMGCGLGGAATWDRQNEIFRDRGPASVSALFIPMLVPNMVAGHLAMELGATGPNFVTATACASGATAIGCALSLLLDGRCDQVITGGSEAGINPLISCGFARMGALSRRVDDPAAASRPFDRERDGFVLGEGSGVLVLEREDDARARGAPIRALLAGYGASADAHHMTAPDPEGRGARSAMGAALAQADLTPSDLDHVNAHGTSTRLNDEVEAKTLRSLPGFRAAVTSTKGVTGHTLGAAGAIEAVLTVLAVQHSTIPPTANLDQQDPVIDLDIVRTAARRTRVHAAMSNSFGFGGQNAVLVFTAA
jgi:beta-ketoacyl-acyl-carrier-protein synthase II